jgi:Arc/MetJ family transcription regulator
MRTTLNLDEELLRDAQEYTGIKGKTAIIHEALLRMVRAEAGKKLAALGGTMRNFKPGRRKRPATTL